MARDGSSGGTIRMTDISKEGVERHFIPGVRSFSPPYVLRWHTDMPHLRTSCRN